MASAVEIADFLRREFPQTRCVAEAVGDGTSTVKTAQLQQTMSGDYVGGRAARRFAGTPLRCLATGFVRSAASNNCRNPNLLKYS